MSLAAILAFAGAASAQTTPEVVRGTSTSKTPAGAKAPAPAKSTSVQKTATSQKPVATSVVRGPTAQQQKKTTPEQLRAARYGGFAPSAPLPAPELDTTSPRSLTLINFNTKEELTVTYWSNGAYYRAALDKLNFFLRDSRDNTQTEMDRSSPTPPNGAAIPAACPWRARRWPPAAPIVRTSWAARSA